MVFFNKRHIIGNKRFHIVSREMTVRQLKIQLYEKYRSLIEGLPKIEKSNEQDYWNQITFEYNEFFVDPITE